MNPSQTLIVQDSRKSKSKTNIALWIVQILLALVFLMAGYPRAFQPLDVVAQSIFWVTDVPPPLVRFIGISELLGAIGLIVPAMTRIQPRLTVPAAAGLSIIMLSASVFHVARGEFFALPMTVTLFSIGGLRGLRTVETGTFLFKRLNCDVRCLPAAGGIVDLLS